MNIQCQGCKSSCLRLDEIINGKCKYCGHDLFTVVFEDETESGVELPCSGVLDTMNLKAWLRATRVESKVGDDPFHLYQQGIMTKGALLEVIVDEVDAYLKKSD